MLYVIRSKDGYFFNDIEKTSEVWSNILGDNVKIYTNPIDAKIQIDRNLENCEIHIIDIVYIGINHHYQYIGLYEKPKKHVYEVFINDRWDDDVQNSYLFSTLKKAQDKMDELYQQYLNEFNGYEDVTIDHDDTHINVETDYNGHIDVYLNIREVL